MNLQFFRLALLVISLSWLPEVALAWGTEGHQVIAKLAEAQLTPKAQVKVQALLALEPGSTLASISTWPDEHRNRATARWHYVNFPRTSCTYDKERECPDGQCVVEAINVQTKVLSSTASDETKLKALKYLVHFVADVHQPLHAGYADDKGGNMYQVRAFGRGTNLHALWDTGLIGEVGLGSDTWIKKSLRNPVPAVALNLSSVNAAQESCQIVARTGFYPERKLVDYIDAYAPVLETRLQLAGSRLAGILNGVWR